MKLEIVKNQYTEFSFLSAYLVNFFAAVCAAVPLIWLAQSGIYYGAKEVATWIFAILNILFPTMVLTYYIMAIKRGRIPVLVKGIKTARECLHTLSQPLPLFLFVFRHYIQINIIFLCYIVGFDFGHFLMVAAA